MNCLNRETERVLARLLQVAEGDAILVSDALREPTFDAVVRYILQNKDWRTRQVSA